MANSKKHTATGSRPIAGPGLSPSPSDWPHLPERPLIIFDGFPGGWENCLEDLRGILSVRKQGDSMVVNIFTDSFTSLPTSVEILWKHLRPDSTVIERKPGNSGLKPTVEP